MWRKFEAIEDEDRLVRLGKEDQDRIECKSCRGREQYMSSGDKLLHEDALSHVDARTVDCWNRISSVAEDKFQSTFQLSSQIVPF